MMQLDNEPMEAYERANAYCNDSARAGASALTSAEDRAFHAEIAALNGKHTYTMLWDISKFFDSIKLQTLINEARATGFHAALSSLPHGALGTEETTVSEMCWRPYCGHRHLNISWLQTLDRAGTCLHY